MYQQLCGLLCHAEDEILNSDGVVAPYCGTLTRVAFFYASTESRAVVLLYLPYRGMYYKGASRRAALAARRFARRLHAMSSAVVVFAFLPAGCLMFFPTRTLTAC